MKIISRSSVLAVTCTALMLSACSQDNAASTNSDVDYGKALADTNWQVEDVNGGGIIDNANLTVLFAKGGLISGSSGCNIFSGQYELDGAALELGPLASTRKACAPALMDLEQKFLSVISNANEVAFDQNGKLIVGDSETGTITATRIAD